MLGMMGVGHPPMIGYCFHTTLAYQASMVLHMVSPVQTAISAKVAADVLAIIKKEPAMARFLRANPHLTNSYPLLLRTCEGNQQTPVCSTKYGKREEAVENLPESC
jgi:hypothetical protein